MLFLLSLPVLSLVVMVFVATSRHTNLQYSSKDTVGVGEVEEAVILIVHTICD